MNAGAARARKLGRDRGTRRLPLALNLCFAFAPSRSASALRWWVIKRRFSYARSPGRLACFRGSNFDSSAHQCRAREEGCLISLARVSPAVAWALPARRRWRKTGRVAYRRFKSESGPERYIKMPYYFRANIHTVREQLRASARYEK